MSLQSDASIGFKKEPTFGTPVTVDRFLEFTEESLDWTPTIVQGAGMRPGKRVARASKRILTKEEVGGGFGLEIPTRGLGTLFEAMFGIATHTLVPTTTGVYQQVFTLIKNDFLPTVTIQKGIPRLGGAIYAMTFAGMSCSSWELSMGNADVLKLSSEWAGKSVSRDIAYAVPSYPLSDLFSFTGAQLAIGGTVTPPTATALATGGTEVLNIRDFTVGVENGLDSDGFNLGGAGQRTRRPALASLAGITGTVTAEFTDDTFVDAVLDQEDFAVLATFEANVEIEAGHRPTLQVVIPNIRFESEIPKATEGVKTQTLEFTGLDDLSGEPIYVVVRTADTGL